MGQILTIRYKKATNQLPFLRCQEQNQDSVCDPCTHNHRGCAQTTKATPPLAPPTCPRCLLWNQLFPLPPPGMGQGTCFLLSLLAGAARIPVKPCLNSSSGLLPISTDYETGWDLKPGTWDPLLQRSHMDTCLLVQQNTKKLIRN